MGCLIYSPKVPSAPLRQNSHRPYRPLSPRLLSADTNSVTTVDLTAILEDLAATDAAAAARQSYEQARRLLPVAATYRTPADSAALWLLSLALYHAGRHYTETAAQCIHHLLSDIHTQLRSDPDMREVFARFNSYPEPLAGFTFALVELPVILVLTACETVREAITAFTKSPLPST